MDETTTVDQPDGSTIRASIAGATGYTGGELIRWLRGHPRVEIARLSANSWAGKRTSDAWPALRDLEDRVLVEADPDDLAESSDVVFLALPHGTAAELAAQLLERDVSVIDLSADFRLRDPELYAKWYGKEHAAPHLLDEAVYGLTELTRERVAEARLVANPGCYPTATALALIPLARAGLLDGPVSVDAKSGVTGAGRAAKEHTSFVEVNESLRPYGVGAHRHQPEMEQTLAEAGADGGVFFSPHLVPMSRGILSTCHFRTSRETSQDEVMALFERAYGSEPFVRLVNDGFPDTRATVGSNFCDVTVRVDGERGVGAAISAIDNLGKGAASQAVQNMNVMFGIDEREGLWTSPTFP